MLELLDSVLWSIYQKVNSSITLDSDYFGDAEYGYSAVFHSNAKHDVPVASLDHHFWSFLSLQSVDVVAIGERPIKVLSCNSELLNTVCNAV